MSEPSDHFQYSSIPPEAWEPFVRLKRVARGPLERFFRVEAASGILLLVAAAVALFWANSPWRESYVALWHTPLGFRVGAFVFERSFEWLVNDVLMAIFFFVVGLEIRREVYSGQLSELRRAILPVAAAIGGMLAPAALYLALAGGETTRSGWGVPMATDIAFAVGVLTLLGKRVPAALRVLLLALAVIDDLGAIIVIAAFYSSGLVWSGLVAAALGIITIFLMQRFGIRSKAAYLPASLVVWAGIYCAGIHPTIAGVIVGMITPVRAWLGQAGFVSGVQRELDSLTHASSPEISSHGLAHALRAVGEVHREAISPSETLIERLHPWVAFGIMPMFALANAGVTVPSGTLAETSWRVISAIAVGLTVGKPLGVLGASWLALRLGAATLPAGLSIRHLVVLGVVAGIGFTMALFIAQLAFADQQLLAASKLGILGASGAAALLALAFGRILLVEKPSRLSGVTSGEAAPGIAER